MASGTLNQPRAARFLLSSVHLRLAHVTVRDKGIYASLRQSDDTTAIDMARRIAGPQSLVVRHQEMNRGDQRGKGGHHRRNCSKPCCCYRAFGGRFGFALAVPLLLPHPSPGVLPEVLIVPRLGGLRPGGGERSSTASSPAWAHYAQTRSCVKGGVISSMPPGYHINGNSLLNRG